MYRYRFPPRALILFASAAFQLGTNMPILRQIDMPPGQPIVDIYYQGGGGYVITLRAVPLPKTGFERMSITNINFAQLSSPNQASSWAFDQQVSDFCTLLVGIGRTGPRGSYDGLLHR